MVEEYAVLAVGTVAKWLIYTGLLWIMIKIQKMQYNVLGLFASSGASILVSFIPIIGSYLSYGVLVLGLWKCTKEDIVPDIVFTVGVAGALMFCVNLWVLGSLMGDLRPDLNADEEETEVAAMEAQDTEPEPEQTKTSAPPAIVSARMHPQAKGLSLKGIGLSSSKPLAMIGSAQHVYTIEPGVPIEITTPQGILKIKCDEITRTNVILTINGAEKVRLSVD